MSSKENPRIKSYWTDLSYVFIPEPLSPLWIECANWFSLNCLATEGAGLGEEDAAPLKWEEISNRKSGSDLRKKNGTWQGTVNSYSPQILTTKITSLEGRKVLNLCTSSCVCTFTVTGVYSRPLHPSFFHLRDSSFSLTGFKKLEKTLVRPLLLIVVLALLCVCVCVLALKKTSKTSLGNFRVTCHPLSLSFEANNVVSNLASQKFALNSFPKC